MNIFRQNEDGINVLIQKSEKLPSNSLGLSITCRGKVYLFETIGLSESKLSVKIPTNDLPSGVNRLTLFDAKGEILSDRLFFVNKADWGQIIVNTDKETYEPFEKVNMSFQVQNNKGEAEETTFSLSVRDAGTMPDENYMDDICTNLLLSSDLKGYIESPGWYFDGEDKHRSLALDLLLMVQGWHRYSWKYSTGLEPFNPSHYVEKEILIKGKILSFDKKKQACPDILVTVEIPLPDSTAQKGKYLTGKDGEFIFSAGNFDGYRYITLLTDKIKPDSIEPVETRITLDRQFTPVARTYPVYENFFAGTILPKLFTSDSTDIENSLERMQFLQEVAISSKGFRPDIVYEIEKEVSYYLDNGLNLPHFWFVDYLQFRDKNYLIEKPNSSNYFSTNYYSGIGTLIDIYEYQGKYTGMYPGSKPTVSTSILEIDKIIIRSNPEWLKRILPELFPLMKSSWSFLKGANIMTLSEILPVAYKGARYAKLSGYSVAKEFYAPDYGKEPPIPGQIDDRRTLYWNPNVKTNNMGNASVVFYKNGSVREMRVNAEGLAKEGHSVINSKKKDSNHK
jgi:hypothetical protein